MSFLKLKIAALFLLKHFFKIFRNDCTVFYTLMLDRLEKKNNFYLIKNNNSF